jgi:hypothetical protein
MFLLAFISASYLFSGNPTEKDFARLFEHCSIKYSHADMVKMKDIYSAQEFEKLRFTLLSDHQQIKKFYASKISNIKKRIETSFTQKPTKINKSNAADIFHEWNLINDDKQSPHQLVDEAIHYITNYKEGMSDKEEFDLGIESVMSGSKSYGEMLDDQIVWQNKYFKWAGIKHPK